MANFRMTKEIAARADKLWKEGNFNGAINAILEASDDQSFEYRDGYRDGFRSYMNIVNGQFDHLEKHGLTGIYADRCLAEAIVYGKENENREAIAAALVDAFQAGAQWLAHHFSEKIKSTDI